MLIGLLLLHDCNETSEGAQNKWSQVSSAPCHRKSIKYAKFYEKNKIAWTQFYTTQKKSKQHSLRERDRSIFELCTRSNIVYFAHTIILKYPHYTTYT